VMVLRNRKRFGDAVAKPQNHRNSARGQRKVASQDIFQQYVMTSVFGRWAL
jgi:hypothetical protein